MGFIERETVGDVEVWRRLEVLCPFPAINHRKLGTFSLQNRGEWRGLGVAPGGTMLVGEVEAELVLIVLDGL